MKAVNQQLFYLIEVTAQSIEEFYRYTATKPVEVTLSHRIPIDNTTLSQLNVQKHGKLFVRHLTAFPGKYLLHQGLYLIIEEQLHHHILLHLFLLLLAQLRFVPMESHLLLLMKYLLI